MITLTNKTTSQLHSFKVDKKSDIDTISGAFVGYTSSVAPDEIILDTSLISEDDGASDKAIAIFGEETWRAMPDGFVLFHG